MTSVAISISGSDDNTQTRTKVPLVLDKQAKICDATTAVLIRSANHSQSDQASRENVFSSSSYSSMGRQGANNPFVWQVAPQPVPDMAFWSTQYMGGLPILSKHTDGAEVMH